MKIYLYGSRQQEGGPGTFIREFEQNTSETTLVMDHADAILIAQNVIAESELDDLLATGKPVFYRYAGFYHPGCFLHKRDDTKRINRPIFYALKNATYTIFQSLWALEFTAKFFCERDMGYYFHPDDCYVIYNGSSIPSRRKQGFNDVSLPVVGVIGRLRHRYQVTFPMQVAGSSFQLLFAGLQDAGLFHLADSGQRPTRIYRSYTKDMLPDILDEIDILMHVPEGDSCPNVVVEALRRGIPVITWKESGAAESIHRAGITIERKISEMWDYEHPEGIRLFENSIKEIINFPDSYFDRAYDRGQDLSAKNIVGTYVNYIKGKVNGYK